MQVEMYAVLKLKTSSGFGHVEVGVGANTAREERVCVGGDTGGGPSTGLEDLLVVQEAPRLEERSTALVWAQDRSPGLVYSVNKLLNIVPQML